MKIKFAKIFFIFVLVISGLQISIAQAVTYGNEEINANTKYPWVVPVFYYEKNATSPSGLCTGTLIKPDVVLTAAHCVPEEGFFEIKYGITSLKEDNKSYLVDGAWRNPRYSESKFGVNDVGLLKLKEPIPNAQFLPIATSPQILKAEKSNTIRILGWGKDQNDVLATYLRSASLNNQSNFLSKILGKNFNRNTWFAAGKYNSKERIYAGGCNGDSGGPLVGFISGMPYQIGITSFGAQVCDTAVPTIFMKLSYFANELKQATKQLYLNSVVTDRSPPENLTVPNIDPNIRVGQLAICNPGTWGQNVSSITYGWFKDGTSIGNSQRLLVSDTYAGSNLECRVTGANRAGEMVKSVTVNVPAKPSLIGNAILSGMPISGIKVAASNAITCNPPSINGTIDSNTFTWWLRQNGYDTNGVNLGQSQTLNFPSSWFSMNSGKVLTCVFVGSGPGGMVRSQVDANIYAPEVAKIYSISVSGVPNSYNGSSSGWIGETVSCDISSNATTDSSSTLSFSWRIYDSSSPYYPDASTPAKDIATGKSLVLTEDILKSAVLKFIGCSATATSPAGSVTAFSTRFYVNFSNIVVEDKTPPTISNVTITPPTDIKLGSRIVVRLTVSDNSALFTNSYSSSGALSLALYGPDNKTISGNLLNIDSTSPDGKSRSYSTYYDLPSAANAGLIGTYVLTGYASDAKNNATGHIQLLSFTIN